MKLGLVKTSLMDYPGLVSAVVFLPGCNLRCPYCHNPELIIGDAAAGLVDIGEVLGFLEKRRGVLDALVISGGEPTLHPRLTELVARARSFGYRIKLDTNGLRPEVLKSLDAPDFLAMDIKSDLEGYPGFFGRLEPGGDFKDCIMESVRFIIDSGIEHHFRTTVCQELIGFDSFRQICRLIKGCREYRITPVRNGNTLKPDFFGSTTDDYLNQLLEICREEGIPGILMDY